MKEEIKDSEKLDLILRNQSLILELLAEYLVKINFKKNYFDKKIKEAIHEISDRIGD